MEISSHHAMAKRPGVSATFHFIAVKDQHCLLYNVIRLDASIFCLHLLFSTFAIIHGTLKISSFHLAEFILQFLDFSFDDFTLL